MELVCHNQILEVFGPENEQVVNINGYDRIHQYYLQPSMRLTTKQSYGGEFWQRG